MVRGRKGAVQIRFEILEYLFYKGKAQPRTYVWRRATRLSYDDFLKRALSHTDSSTEYHLLFHSYKSLEKELRTWQRISAQSDREFYGVSGHIVNMNPSTFLRFQVEKTPSFIHEN